MSFNYAYHRYLLIPSYLPEKFTRILENAGEWSYHWGTFLPTGGDR